MIAFHAQSFQAWQGGSRAETLYPGQSFDVHSLDVDPVAAAAGEASLVHLNLSPLPLEDTMNDRARMFLICAILSFVTCAGGLWYLQDDINYLHNGPIEISAKDLVKVEDLARLSSRWVRFSADKVVPTDAHLVTGVSDMVLGTIYLVQVEDRWLIALLNADLSGNTIEGQLISGRRYWTKEIDQVIQNTATIHNGQLMSVELLGYDDHKSDKKVGFYFLLVCGGVGGLLLVFGLYWVVCPPAPPAYSGEDLYSEEAYARSEL